MKKISMLTITLCMILGLTACGGESKVKTRETEAATLEQEEIAEEIEVNGVLDIMEYAMVISSMQQMGCWNVCWDFLDADGDGRQELYMTAFAEDSERQHQFIADASGPYFKAHVATGAAGSSEFLTIYGYDSYILQDGYYTVGNTSVSYYEWNGSDWEEVFPATGAADYAVFPNPDPVTAWMNVGFEQAVSVLHDKLTKRENYMSDLRADFNGDGVDEYVYFYQGVANRWFGRLESDNNFGTEPYLEYRDYTWTTVVLSWDEERGQTCVRIGNFGEYNGLDVVVEGNIMTFNGEDYAYQQEGIPFLYQGVYDPYSPETISGSDVDLGIATLYVPDSWNGRVTMINEGMSVSIYESNDYALGGGGYIRTIGFSTEYDTGHPARTLYASMDVNGTTYYLYMEEPTDVPYIDFANIEAGMAISNEIDMQFLMDHIGAHQDYVLDWFIG